MPPDADQNGQPNPAPVVNDQASNGQPAPKTGPAETVTLSQEHLKAVAAREKGEGRKAAIAELTSKLGMTVEEAQKLIADSKAREDAEKSEAQKAKEAADQLKAEAEAEKAKASSTIHAVKVERSLSTAGLQPRKDENPADFQKRLERCARLVDAEIGASDEELTAAVEAVKASIPELFGSAQVIATPPSGEGKGAGPIRVTQAGGSKMTGQERAAKWAADNGQATRELQKT